MVNIRSRVFETNSSSTHSLSVTKEKFTNWIFKVFEDFKEDYPDDDMDLKIDVHMDGYGNTVLTATFEISLDD